MRVLANNKSSSKWGLFEKRFVVPDYDNPSEPSRVRWRLIYTPYFGVYLHKWYKPDPRRTRHNHPWPFVSLILRGQYQEVIGDQWGQGRTRFVRWINWVPRECFHDVFSVVPGTLSLMFVGKDHDAWGYSDNSKYVPYDQHPHNEEFKSAMNARAQEAEE